MFTRVKLNRYAFSFLTDPSSYFRYSTLKPQQSQLYEASSAPYWIVPWFKSSPAFAGIPRRVQPRVADPSKEAPFMQVHQHIVRSELLRSRIHVEVPLHIQLLARPHPQPRDQRRDLTRLRQERYPRKIQRRIQNVPASL